MEASCRERLLSAITQYPDGWPVEAILRQTSQPAERAEMLSALHKLVQDGYVILEVKCCKDEFTSATVRPGRVGVQWSTPEG